MRAKLTALQSDTDARQSRAGGDEGRRRRRGGRRDDREGSRRSPRIASTSPTARWTPRARWPRRSFAEQERKALNEAGEKARLDSRTREADAAKTDALVARAESAEQKVAADSARSDADAAQLAANASQQQAAELQRQIEVLQARPTDRGLVLTLGDTLFATGKSEIKSGATANLDRLTTFMNEYPKRTAAIEGYTDSMGSDEMNQSLSQRRADAVKRYLVGQGVGSARLTSSGRGENSPVADNESAAGRQQNRRVEVVISQL